MFLLTLQVTKKTTVGTSEFAQGCEAIGFEGEGVFLQTVDFLVGKIFGFISPGDAEKVFELFKLQAERTLGNPNVEER